MTIDYNDPTFNLLTRQSLPTSLAASLNPNPAWAGWRSVKQNQPPIEMWLQMHKGFLATIDQIDAVTLGLQDAEESDLADLIRESNLLSGSQNLILQLEQHHAMEDQVYFPKFVTLLPRLKAPMEMLDQDHIELEHIMQEINASLDCLTTIKPARGDIAKLHQHARQLRRCLKMHIENEEDIIMPDLMEIGIERLLTD